METAGVDVCDGVDETGLRELNGGGLRRREGGDREFRSHRQIVILIQTKRFSVVGGVTTTVER